jgi:hypothetical protein
MDNARGTLVPLAAVVRLRGIQARWGAISCREEMGEGTHSGLGWSLIRGKEGLSGLPHY